MKALVALTLCCFTAVAVAQPVNPLCAFPENSFDCPTPNSVPRIGVAANGVVAAVPPGASIQGIRVIETAGNAITGGINIGTTAGGRDVVNGFAVAGSSSSMATIAAAGPFSTTAVTLLYASPGSAWNSAVVNLRFYWSQGP